MTLWQLCSLFHLLGLGMGLGAALAKVTLVLAAAADRRLIPFYLQVSGRITRFIVAGMALLTLSGIGWLLLGRPITALLVVKLVLSLLIWVLGPMIDKVAEPRFRQLAPADEGEVSPAFLAAERNYKWLEVVATALMVVVTVIGALL